MAELKKYVDQTALEALVGKIKSEDNRVLNEATAYADGLATNYEPSGAIATAKTELEGKISTAQAAAEAADAKAVAAQQEVDALETLVGALPEGTSATSVVDYVNVKTAGIATDAALEELNGQVSGLQTAVQGIQADYLVEADKTELSGLITAEADRAKAAEKVNADAIAAVVADYLKAEDKTELAGDIAAAQKAADDVQAEMDAFKLAAEVGDAAVDTLKEIQDYITTDGQAAAKMTEDIGKNADAIDAVEGRLDVVEPKVTTLEGEMDDAQAAIEALQAKFGEGEGGVEDMIAAAIAVETQARETAIAGVQEDADKGIADAAAALEAAQQAAASATSLNEAMDARVAVVEGKAHEHANKAELDLIATGDKAKWDAAEAKAHEHANKEVIDGITADKVALWDTVSAKAESTALDAAVARIAANESAIASFQPIAASDVEALFA